MMQTGPLDNSIELSLSSHFLFLGFFKIWFLSFLMTSSSTNITGCSKLTSIFVVPVKNKQEYNSALSVTHLLSLLGSS